MENMHICQVIDLNVEIESLMARLETIKADLSIEEAMREAFSKDITPTILKRKVRYKRVNGKKVEFTEVTIYESELKILIEMASCRARVEEIIKRLEELGARLKRELSQTEIYKNSCRFEAEVKQIRNEKMLLEAKVKDLNREIEKILSQNEDPYIDYEEQIFDLEIE